MKYLQSYNLGDMLPQAVKPKNFGSLNQESWESYQQRLNIAGKEALGHFYRQVVFDHFDHFNDHYPDFVIKDYDFGFRSFSVLEVEAKIRYFDNETIDWWADQYDKFAQKNYRYIIFQEMSKNLTPPFPPVVVDPVALEQLKGFYGEPLHLVEGTHRVSYFKHMCNIGLISPDSRHSFVMIEPKTS